MTMKKYLFLVSAIMAFCLGSCTKDDTISNLGATTGDEIKFVASITDNTTRTVYGDKTGNSYPLYWVTGDKVAVYSPQALSAPISGEVDASQTYAGPADVTYTVGTTSNSNTYALSGEAANLYWGTGEGNNGTHEFYTFYPSHDDRIYKKDTDGTFVVTVPREQNATVTQNGDTYTAVDMSAAIMAGYTTVDRNTYNGEEIVLPFTPLTTAFDIEILPPTNKLPENTTGIDAVTITSITIANPSDVTTNRKILAGGFNYNAKTGAFSHYTNSSTTNTEDANAYIVNIQLSKPVTLESGSNQKLIVTGFLLPHIMYASSDTTDTTLRIMINCREGENSGAMKVHSKDITWTNANKATFEMKKSTVKLGELPNPIVFSYETWMANLPDNTYVSQISMPGTHDAGAYTADSGFDNAFAQTQFVDIITQLNSGIRVLDFRPKYISGEGKDAVYNIAHGYITYEDRTFDYVFKQAIDWLAEHPTEFIIVQLKNEFGSDNASQTGWQAHMREKLLNISTDYVIDTFDPDMTLKEARGKLLFLSRDFYVGTDGDTTDHNHESWVGGKFNFGTDNNNFTEGFLGIGKKFDNYWSTNVFTSASPSALGAIFYISDLYKGAWIGSGTGIVNPDEADKQQCISETIKAASGDADKTHWYFTFINVSGTDRPNSKYNTYTANLINNLSSSTYQRAGVIMLDWACPFAGSGTVNLMKDNGTIQNVTITNSYKGYELTKAVIDNNFKGGGPAKKAN